uniref:DDE Tnp4 domain-containing protein n=1 Tax=Iconisemion striatum TaxID=60296 RepID=A0A1A7W9J8_9TELE
MMRISRRKAYAALLLLAVLRRDRRRRLWVNPLNRLRSEQGDFHRLVAELRLDAKRHHEYFRMSAEQMDGLLSIIGPELQKQSTNYRAAIEPKQRLAVALRYLASGDSLISLASSYRLGHSTVSNSVHMVCAAIEKLMMQQHLPKPTKDMWTEVAQGFWTKWNFPNCLGAIDGKHVFIQAPPNSGRQYLNNRKGFSRVLLALVDADFRFRVIQVGDFGQTSDRGTYAASDLGRGMESGTLEVPPNTPLSGAAHLGNVPFVMVGNGSFPLKTYLMRPYPLHNLNHDKKIFNYRLSRARMVVENAFGILSSRWRIFLRKINLHPKHVDTLVMAACILHNFLLVPSDNLRLLYEAEQQGVHRMVEVVNMGGNRGSRASFNIRESYTNFFNSHEGSVSWQEKMI